MRIAKRARRSFCWPRAERVGTLGRIWRRLDLHVGWSARRILVGVLMGVAVGARVVGQEEAGAQTSGHVVPLVRGEAGADLRVTALASDGNGIVWVGTEGDGV